MHIRSSLCTDIPSSHNPESKAMNAMNALRGISLYYASRPTFPFYVSPLGRLSSFRPSCTPIPLAPSMSSVLDHSMSHTLHWSPDDAPSRIA
jgi:hypothetical protein